MCTFVRRKEEKDSNLALAFYSYLLAEADMAGDAAWTPWPWRRRTAPRDGNAGTEGKGMRRLPDTDAAKEWAPASAGEASMAPFAPLLFTPIRCTAFKSLTKLQQGPFCFSYSRTEKKSRKKEREKDAFRIIYFITIPLKPNKISSILNGCNIYSTVYWRSNRTATDKRHSPCSLVLISAASH
jgi:hypothetical protein